jgi:hypothetical protein
MTIDRAVLTDIYTFAAEAAGAVWRLNARMGGIVQERACVAAVFETGVAPAGCR